MNLVLVVPWSMAATYTSSPSPAMIPLAGTRSAVEEGSSDQLSGKGREDWRWSQTNRWQLRRSRAPERRRKGEFIGDDGWIRLGRRRTGRSRVGGEVNGRRAVYTSALLAYPLRSSRAQPGARTLSSGT